MKRNQMILAALFAGSILGVGVYFVFAREPQSAKEVQSSFDTVRAPVLKVFSAEDDGHRFVAYLVKWKESEVIVSDTSGLSNFQEGDEIHFMVQKMRLSVSELKVSTVNFSLIDSLRTPPDREGTEAEGNTVSPAEEARQMKIVQGDLGAVKNENERFYALNGAAKKALKEGELEQARTLAAELESLLPKYENDWNYGNAVQDANQVLGLIALSEGDVAEAKRRLLASADSDGSPQMNSFGPNMQLAKALLENDERDVVLEYFKRCGTFWTLGEKDLVEWSALVKNGRIPDFGGNLHY